MCGMTRKMICTTFVFIFNQTSVVCRFREQEKVNEAMPLVRYEVRCEHSLATSELYHIENEDDSKRLLEGVAMAGLVGIIRQLGDLAEYVLQFQVFLILLELIYVFSHSSSIIPVAIHCLFFWVKESACSLVSIWCHNLGLTWNIQFLQHNVSNFLSGVRPPYDFPLVVLHINSIIYFFLYL